MASLILIASCKANASAGFCSSSKPTTVLSSIKSGIIGLVLSVGAFTCSPVEEGSPVAFCTSLIILVVSLLLSIISFSVGIGCFSYISSRSLLTASLSLLLVFIASILLIASSLISLSK